MTLNDWLNKIEKLHPNTIELGLDRIKKIAEPALLNFFHCPVITVGGTNGKGSTVAILSAIYQAAGFRVGTYTSPHLYRFNERVCINGEAVSDQCLVDAFSYIDNIRQNKSLTYFEFTTCAALHIFQQAQLDIVILEVGLGGRLDAVNIVDPDLAIITTIDLDHQQWLGDNRESIAKEKAGIFRPKIPVVCGDSQPPTSLIDAAANLNAPLFIQHRDFMSQVDEQEWHFDYKTLQLKHLPIPCLALSNASTALMAITCLQHQAPVNLSAIKQGLTSVRLTARCQIVSSQPLIIFDVAHNAQSSEHLANFLQQRFPDKRFHAVFSCLKDKAFQHLVTPLAQFVQRWHVAGLPVSRGMPMLELQQQFAQLGLNASGYDSIEQAFSDIKQQLDPSQGLIVYGSFHTISHLTV